MFFTAMSLGLTARSEQRLAWRGRAISDFSGPATIGARAAQHHRVVRKMYCANRMPHCEGASTRCPVVRSQKGPKTATDEISHQERCAAAVRLRESAPFRRRQRLGTALREPSMPTSARALTGPPFVLIATNARRALLALAVAVGTASCGPREVLPPVSPAPIAACLTLVVRDETARKDVYDRDVQKAVRTSFEQGMVSAGFNVLEDATLPHDLLARLVVTPGSRLESGARVTATLTLEHSGQVVDRIESSAPQEAPGYDAVAATDLVISSSDHRSLRRLPTHFATPSPGNTSPPLLCAWRWLQRRVRSTRHRFPPRRSPRSTIRRQWPRTFLRCPRRRRVPLRFSRGLPSRRRTHSSLGSRTTRPAPAPRAPARTRCGSPISPMGPSACRKRTSSSCSTTRRTTLPLT